MNQLLKLLILFLFVVLLAIVVVMFDDLIGFHYNGLAHQIILHNIGTMVQGILTWLVLGKLFLRKDS